MDSNQTVIVPGNAFYLFGYPIAHSASPAFHNELFRMRGLDNEYVLWSTSQVTEEMINVVRGETFGGASITMPLKTSIIPYLDRITPEANVTSAVNTIVKVGSDLVGTNTDILGIRNALVRALRLQFPSKDISSSARFAKGAGAAVVFGGGATTRSAVYALGVLLGLHPIYLVNRLKSEVEAVQAAFPDLTLVHLSHPDSVEKLLVDDTDAPPVLIIVGAIPAIPPATKEERMVYTVASSLFTLPYQVSHNHPSSSHILPIPSKRLFLEMAYKPRNTPMLQVATAHGWDAVGGIQSMIEQGHAQHRFWNRGTVDVAVGSDPTILGLEAEGAARHLLEIMVDIVSVKEEVDRSRAEL